jgi:hypothetical protein
MVAASHGWTQATKQLLSIGFDANSSNGQTSAVDLAYDNNHLDTVLVLLANNSKFPDNFHVDQIDHEGLQKFIETTNEFHNQVHASNFAGIDHLASQNPNLKHFYGLDESLNKSAASIALHLGKLDVYRQLLSNYILPSPDELKATNFDRLEQLRDLHTVMFLPDPASFLAVLSGSSFIGAGIDKYEKGQRHYRVTMALEQLNEIPGITPLLQFVARTGRLRIVFDFGRDHWEVEDVGTKGAFHPTKHVYVGAKKLLNAQINSQQDIYGVLAKELCHYALELLYKNGGKPYKVSDSRFGVKKEYREAITQCEVNKGHEKIVAQAFGGGAVKVDLITRAPQLLVHHSKDPERLAKVRGYYSKLFRFYDQRVVEDITRKVPKVDKIMMQRNVSFEERVSKSVWTRKRVKVVGVVLGLMLVAAVMTMMMMRRNEMVMKGGGENFWITLCSSVKK